MAHFSVEGPRLDAQPTHGDMLLSEEAQAALTVGPRARESNSFVGHQPDDETSRQDENWG